MSNPWLKFYPSDWTSDPKLRMCSLAARGLWIEMICIMHEADPYGHLLVYGLSPTDAQLAVLAGTPPDLIPELLGELETVGVFSRTRKGVIYSRKLTRMQKKAAISRKNGQNGGNPTLCKQRKKIASVNPPHKGRDKPQKLEARYQKDSLDKSKLCSFPEFWDVWPNKNAKVAAEKAWGKLSCADRISAKDGASDWFHRWRQGSPQASPILPASYLNGKRWTDEVSVSQKNGGDDEISRWKRLANQ